LGIFIKKTSFSTAVSTDVRNFEAIAHSLQLAA
jgi:hypothetical protein